MNVMISKLVLDFDVFLMNIYVYIYDGPTTPTSNRQKASVNQA
jgi:hypothetical protein